MTGLNSVADVVADLIDRPRPVLCLDSCELLDIVRSFTEEGNAHAALARKMIAKLDSDPDHFQPMITDLVRFEWEQNRAKVAKKSHGHLERLDQQTARVVEALDHARIEGTPPPPGFSGLSLVPKLLEMAEDLISRSIILRRDEACVGRALDRVMEGKRPSHHGMIKDSIHLEHYLELGRALGRSHLPRPCVFVSGNRSDFWAGPPQPHGDLVDDFKAARVEFFGKLDAALGRLGV